MGIFKKEKLTRAAATPAAKTHTILLVDDEPANLTVLSAILAEHYDILQAQDGDEAYELISKMDNPEKISLIISDQRMPKLTGTQLFEKIKPITPNTLRILLTGYSDVNVISEAINNVQLYRYLCKPFDRNDMLLTVRHAIEAFDMQQRLTAFHRDMEYQAYHDVLTNLPNRRCFDKALNGALQTAANDNALMGIGLIKLDRFKAVIAGQGHAFGDQLLLAAVKRLNDVLREQTIVAHATLYRFDGVTFALIAPGLADLSALEALAKRFVEAMSEALLVNAVEFYLNLDIGLSCYPRDGNDAVTLVKNADAAFTQAKELTGSNIVFYQPEMNERAERLLQLEQQLRHAAERHELKLFYQPQVEVSSGRVIGAEALIRWQHPDSGLVSPLDFIPLAESTGLIVPIGEWVIREACQQIKRWLCEGRNLVVAVNISARQFQHPDFTRMVFRIIEDVGIPASNLEMELTESILVGDIGASITIMKALRDFGIRLSIDDFGTGYSSLNYLKSFPLHKLKVDQSFVRGLHTSSEDAAITQTIVTLGHTLGLKVIAEGIETQEHLSKLAGYGCEYMQGYLISRPIPSQDFAIWHDQWVSKPLH